MRAVDPELHIAASARVVGRPQLGPGVTLAQGAVVRARGGAVTIGAGSAVLENCVVVGTPDHPARIGPRTVFGHRVVLVGATVGALCEIGNGAIVNPGAVLGDRVFLGEGALVPAGARIDDGGVLVGRPARRIRTADAGDIERLTTLRGGDLTVPTDPAVPYQPPPSPSRGDAHPMGTLHPYRDTLPTVDPTAVLFDSAELTGDVIVGAGTVIAAGVKIVGDSHGPVRIGARVQILENTVLHLLPDNELVVEADVVIGPGAMVHGCHLGAGTVLEPAAIVADGAAIGAGSLVRTGSLVPQRAQHPPRSVLEGFPAKVVGTLDAPPERPSWAFDPDELPG